MSKLITGAQRVKLVKTSFTGSHSSIRLTWRANTIPAAAVKLVANEASIIMLKNCSTHTIRSDTKWHKRSLHTYG